MKNLYIYIDESGNFDFTPKGTEYYILTSVSFFKPYQHKMDFDSLKYDFLKKGRDIEHFHASPDKQKIRDEVFNIIENMNSFEIDSIVAQKNKANLSLYQNNTEEKFYEMISEKLLQYVGKRFLEFKQAEINNIVIIFDAIFTERKRNFITKKIKKLFKNKFDKIPYLYFHSSKSDYNCQIVDYCCWAIYVKWERHGKEMRPYEKIKDKIESEFDIFKSSNKSYY